MGSGFIPLLVGTIMYSCMWECGSEKLSRHGRTRVQYPIWPCGRVHISVNVLRRVAAKLAVHSAINVIIWPFSILSRIPIVGVGYCIMIVLSQCLYTSVNGAAVLDLTVSKYIFIIITI